MERSEQGERTLAQRVVHWRSIGLIGACVAGGVTLSMMVIGSGPTVAVPGVAAPEASPAEAAVVGPTTTVAFDTPTTEALVGSAEAPVDPAAPLGGDIVIEDAPAAIPANVPAGVPPASPTAPVPAATSTTSLPAAAAPVPTAAPATTAPTAAPTTASPAPQPSPAPTTQPPTNVSSLTYPSYTLSGVSDVSLQFDGSSIYVVSLTPQPKWVYEVEKNGPRSVEVKFFNVDTGRDREFHATVEGGRIEVES